MTCNKSERVFFASFSHGERSASRVGERSNPGISQEQEQFVQGPFTHSVAVDGSRMENGASFHQFTAHNAPIPRSFGGQ